MERTRILLEIVAGAAGHLVWALLSLAAIGVLLWVQVREYRSEWREARGSWWAIKLGVPFGGLVVVGLALFLVRDTQGFTGLAVFYAGVVLWLVAGPFVVGALVARAAGVPRSLAMRAAGTLVAFFVVAWFGGASAANSLVAAFRPVGDLDAKVEYEAFARILESTPPPAGDAVRLIDERVYAMPDDRRLVHLAWAVDPDLEFHGQRVRVGEPAGPSIWNSTLGHCRAPGEFHLTNVLEAGEWLEVRLAWHRGTPASAVGVEHRIESAPGTERQLPWLAVRLREERLEVPVPVPEHLLDWLMPDDGRLARRNHGRHFGEGAYSRRCLFAPIEAPAGAAGARVSFYSEERHDRVVREVFAAGDP
jgi:hypothetical protein